MYDNLKERLTDMSVLASTRTPADALQYIEELEAKLSAANDRIEGLEELLWAAENDAKEAEAYAGELEAENHLLKTSGIAEVSVRNPNVMEYMKHWEGRTEAAEAELPEQIEWVKQLADDLIAAEGREARLKEKLARAVEALGNISNIGVAWSHKHEDQIKEAQEIARTTLAELTGGKDE